MTWSRSNWIVVGVLAVAVAVYTLAVHRPQQRKLGDVRARIERAKAQLEQDDARAERIPQLQREVQRYRSEFHSFDNRLPLRQELAEFLREISSSAGSGRLADLVIQPGSPTRDTLYNRLPIVMNFHCSFADLVGFLARLDEMTRLTRVERISIRPTSNTEQDLKVEMQINIYFTES